LVSAWWFRRTEHIVPNHLIAVPHPNVTIAKRIFFRLMPRGPP